MERGNEEQERAKLLGSLKMVPVEAVNRDGSVKAEYFNQMLPPGYRFEPSDEELMLLLRKKINNETMPFHKICVADVYAASPQQLTREHKLDREEEWYFFSSRNRKYPSGSRPNRAAGFGFWKATGSEKTLFTEGNENFTKTSLDYYFGVPKQSTRTDWKMHEFVFKGENLPPQNKRNRNGDRTIKLNDWVLCRIYKSSRSGLGDNTTIAEMNPKVVAPDIGGQDKANLQAFSNHAIKDPRFFQNSSQAPNEILTNPVSSSNQQWRQSESRDPTFVTAPCQISPDSMTAISSDPTSGNVESQNEQNLVTTSDVDPNDNDNWLSDLNDITFTVEEITRILDEDDQGLNDLLTNDEKVVAWKAPDHGWIKLNINIRCNNKNGGQTQAQAACSGVFRDFQGQWLLGFILNLSPGHTELADLWALQMGLQLAWQKRFKNLCVESESEALMLLLENGCAADHSGAMLLNRVKESMARKEWQVRLELISEKANLVAHDVAGYGLGLQMGQGFQVLQQPPEDCLAALTFDMMSSPKCFESVA